MKKIFLICILTLAAFSTVSGELQTRIIHNWDGSAEIEQWNPDDGYTYSRHVNRGDPINPPTEEINMTDDEIDALRGVNNNNNGEKIR
jgi:hypothetical protein